MIYNELYYQNYDEIGYEKKEKWFPFFEMIADRIVKCFEPKTVLDVGCAYGYLVEALRNRGVEAYGIDVSAHAIQSVRSDLSEFVNAQSVVDALPDSFLQNSMW